MHLFNMNYIYHWDFPNQEHTRKNSYNYTPFSHPSILFLLAYLQVNTQYNY